MDKSTRELVLEAELIPGARAALREIHKAGCRIALVADGLDQSFRNVLLKQHGLEDCFDAWVVSEIVGEKKPSPKMFSEAMRQLHLSDDDKKNIVMLGNNLPRDIAGANRFGIRSVLLDWSPRYNYSPKEADEKPDYIIHSPAELPALLAKLEEA
jgi:putative hydrolase of the HAD superfamily